MGSAGSFFKSLLTTSLLQEKGRHRESRESHSPAVQAAPPCLARRPRACSLPMKCAGTEGCFPLFIYPEPRAHGRCGSLNLRAERHRPGPQVHGSGRTVPFTMGEDAGGPLTPPPHRGLTDVPLLGARRQFAWLGFGHMLETVFQKMTDKYRFWRGLETGGGGGGGPGTRNSPSHRLARPQVPKAL